MIDQAGYLMAGGAKIALARVKGVNDNMSSSHYHDYFEIYYLEAGTRWHVADHQLHCIDAGELIIFPPYVMHHSYGAEDVAFKRIVAYFTPEVVLGAELLKRISAKVTSYRFDARARSGIDWLFAEMLRSQQNREEFFADELRLLTNELLIRIVRQEPADTQVERTTRMMAVMGYLHDHHAEQLTLETIAGSFFISTYHLCREFKKFAGSTVMQYLTNVRVGQAQRLLNETDLTITQISKQVGFANVTHFNRVFKQVTAMSPSAAKQPLPEAPDRRRVALMRRETT